MRNSTIDRLRRFSRRAGAAPEEPAAGDPAIGEAAFTDPSFTDPSFSEEEREIAAALVSPLFHAVVNERALARDRVAALDAILASPEAAATSPLFDPVLYAARFQAEGGVLAPGEAATLAHWIRTGRMRRIVPNALFDAAYYRETYADVAALDLFGFVHFALWGIHEGRLPNAWFDPEAYSRLHGTAAGQAPFAHYVAVGAALGATLPRRGGDKCAKDADEPEADGAEALAQLALEAEAAAALHRSELRAIFLPWFYAGLIGQKDAGQGDRDQDNARDPDALWEHYLSVGLAAGDPPHPLFDPLHYATQIDAIALPAPAADQPLILHWLEIGRSRQVVPTRFFDAAHYEAVHPDIGGLTFGFMHYLANGLKEGRAPTIWFDHRWYADRPDGEADDYARFLVHGLDEGRMPSALVEHILRSFAPNAAMTRPIHDALLAASAGWEGTVPAASLWLLVSLYVPAWHPEAKTPLDGFIGYLGDGLRRDAPPGPLFDAAFYRARAAAAGLPFGSGDSAILHWLRHGAAARIVPTERFDEPFYRLANPDIGRTASWGFAHFIRNGVFEGRAPDNRPAFRLLGMAEAAQDTADLPAAYRQWHAADFPERAAADPAARTIRANQIRLDALLRSNALQEAFAAAQAVEPDVGDIDSLAEYLLPPFHARLATAHAALRRRIPGAQYDTVLCVPWIRTGGADLVAGLLAKALLRIRPAERILVLRTDQPHAERANWLPKGADVALMADLTAELAPAEAQNLLRAVLRGVGARRVFNVNSRLCWTTQRAHGTNLARTLRSYAYMFCWDQTPSGLRAGYPAEFFADTVDTMTAFLTDTAYLRDELTQMYRLPQGLRDRILPLRTPAQAAVTPVAMARLVADAGDRAPLILWAGRLDRQKRFDLVQEIARLMPDVAFHCWGAALLDAPPDLARLPPNVTMRGSFDRFDDLPLDQARAWLFTAAWEGMPTTVIELATRGVAIVASAVGGVPELIRPDTGWPIAADAEADSYVAALRDILDHPAEAARRAEALQLRVGSLYTEAVYDADLGRLLDEEDRT